MTTESRLLDKTELRIEPLDLHGANLTEVASVVADILGLRHDEVVVIDARDHLLALDILSPTVDPYRIAGREQDLLAALARIPGLAVDERTGVCSEGVLGWIVADREDALDAFDRASTISEEIDNAISRRALVLSTGPEVLRGQIEDTNKPWIVQRLRDAGFRVTAGPDLPDRRADITSALHEAGTELGFGLVVTTGGVGAEDKDTTIEALLGLDPGAATPDLFHVSQAHGRHVKAAVRIAVGRVGTATVVCLPGPHAEATLGVETMVTERSLLTRPDALADRIAAVLRGRLRGLG